MKDLSIILLCVLATAGFGACDLFRQPDAESAVLDSTKTQEAQETIKKTRFQFNEPALSPFFDCYEDFTNRLNLTPVSDKFRPLLIDGFAAELGTQLGQINTETGWNDLRENFSNLTYCSVFWTAFAGVIAHIGYDLVFSLTRNFKNSADLEAAEYDYFLIGDELRDAVPSIQYRLARDYDSGITKISRYTPFDLDVFISSTILTTLRRNTFEIALSYLRGDISEAELQRRAIENYRSGIQAIDRIEAIMRPTRLLRNYCKEQ